MCGYYHIPCILSLQQVEEFITLTIAKYYKVRTSKVEQGQRNIDCNQGALHISRNYMLLGFVGKKDRAPETIHKNDVYCMIY